MFTIMVALGNYSCYSFHGSMLRPQALAKRAKAAGFEGVGLSDGGGFYGAVEFSQGCGEFGLKAVFGTRVGVDGLGSMQLTVREREGYGALCRALTAWGRNRSCIPLASFRKFWEEQADNLWLSAPIAARSWNGISVNFRPRDPVLEGVFPYRIWRERWRQISELPARDAIWIELGWATAEERDLQRRVFNELSGRWERWVIMTGARLGERTESKALKVLQAIGTRTRIGQRHPQKLPPGDYALPSAEALKERFRKAPAALAGSEIFASGCHSDFSYSRRYLPSWNTRAGHAVSGESSLSGSSSGVWGNARPAPPAAGSGEALAGGEKAGRGLSVAERERPYSAHGASDFDNEQLRCLCREGLERRYGKGSYPWEKKPRREAIEERLGRELRVVGETGYAGYFLIFHDVVEACRKRGIPVLARGSAAGSLICYCLGVSNVCPFRFGLSFERFLNMERLKHSKLPDIDLDLPWDRRDEIIAYLYEKYGAGHVAMIGGFSTFKARAAVAETAKCYGMPDHAARDWTRCLPRGRLRSFLKRSDDHVEARHLKEEDRFAEICDIALQLEGLPRHPMMHPCGIVIANRPLADFTPLDPSHKGFAMTQMAMDAIEDLGLLKLDLLGQAGLSVIRDAVANIRGNARFLASFSFARGERGKNWEDVENENYGKDGGSNGKRRRVTGVGKGGASFPDPRDPLRGVDYRAPFIFEMLARGEARGVFHIESPAMTGLLRLCRCADIDCLVATVSVIRPGAANEDKKNKFARRYLGLEPSEYAHPALEPFLRDTYGLMVYEEHIILVAHHFAGMDLGSADLLRRILVKKKDGRAMAELAAVFKACARGKGRREEETEKVWRLLVEFSGYMFNKAHGAAYAIEAFHACWLKYYWPVHFLAAVLQNRRGFYRPLVYVLEARRHGCRFLLPDVSSPSDRFCVIPAAAETPASARREDWKKGPGAGAGERGSTRWRIRIPLWLIKGLSAGFPTLWRTARERRPFADWGDFLFRAQPEKADLLLLARAGALRAFFPSRYRAVWEAQRSGKRERETLAMEAGVGQIPDFPPEDLRLFAEWEVELLGFPVTVSPFAYWLEGIDTRGTVSINRLENYIGEEVEIAGIVVCSRKHTTSRGEFMKFISLADATGIADITVFPRAYREYGCRIVRMPALRARVEVCWDKTRSGANANLIAVVA